MQKKLDKETEKIFTRGEQLRFMTQGQGWVIAKEMLLKRAANLLNMADITDLRPETIIQLIGIRQETAKNLMLWLKDIEGTVEQHTANSTAFTDVKDEYIINLQEVQ